MSQRSSPNILAVSLLSGLAGATIALLVAPRSGRETRDKLREQTGDLKHRAEDKLANAKDRIGSQVDRLSSAVNRTGRKARREMDELKSDIESQERETNKQSPVLSSWEEEV